MLYRRLAILFTLLLIGCFAGVVPAHDHEWLTDCHECDQVGELEICSCSPAEHAPGQHVPKEPGHHQHDCSHCNICQLSAALAMIAPSTPCISAPALTSNRPWLFPQRAERRTFIHTFDSRGPPVA